MSDDETMKPLQDARQRIDDAIAAYLEKVAALRKRREGIQTAIDIIRMGDDEIMRLPTLVAHKNGTVKRIIAFDEASVERRVLELLASGEMKFPAIKQALENEGVTFSIAGLRRILKTSPKVKMIGEREKTCYRLVG